SPLAKARQEDIYQAIKELNDELATDSSIVFEKTEDPQQISLNRIIQAAGVSRRAYFYWCSGGRATNPAPAEFNELILAQIKIEFEQSNRTRGTHSMTTAINVWLERQGLPKVNHKRIYRLMRQSGMVSVIRKKRPGYHKTQADYIAENTLNGDFERKGINEVWATDSTFVTYGKHNEMGIWLCGVIDLYSHEILGSSLSKTQTTVAAKEAFDQAYVSFPYAKPLVHSDRGS
ncbi:IS3 family transposase, partial [Agrilactobacillus composti]|uniref:IS3 family transposase n=2 Tax=Agrilactobacillus composti TaxID=398555 RepID=UPI000552E9B8